MCTANSEVVFLVFDLVAHGQDAADGSFYARYLRLAKDVLPEPVRLKTITVRVKAYHPLSSFRSLVANHGATGLGFEIDGFIFQPTRATAPVYKHKRVHTVDVLSSNGKLYVGHYHELVGARLEGGDGEDGIIECSLERDGSGRYGRGAVWRFLRRREDKHAPNALRTYETTLALIRAQASSPPESVEAAIISRFC